MFSLVTVPKEKDRKEHQTPILSLSTATIFVQLTLYFFEEGVFLNHNLQNASFIIACEEKKKITYDYILPPG